MGIQRTNNYGGEKHTNAKHYVIPLIITDQTSVTIDTANLDPALVGQVEVVNTAIAGTLLTEQTFTGANSLAATAVIGIGILESDAVGATTGLAKRVSGYGVVLSNTGAGNTGTAGAGGFTVGGITGQTIPGISTSGNVAVLCTIVGGVTSLNAAAGAGKAVIHLVVG